MVFRQDTARYCEVDPEGAYDASIYDVYYSESLPRVRAEPSLQSNPHTVSYVRFARNEPLWYKGFWG
jgi:hypothetical protein